MNRRRAIWGIALLGGSSLVAGASAWLVWHKKPDLAYLARQKPLLAALAETILPATDTPGAIDAGVPDFLLKMLLENTTPAAQNRFMAGLASVEGYCRDSYGRSYVQCSPEQQHVVMRRIEADGQPRGGMVGKVERKLMGESFFSLLKSYTCLGYYTSMLGATRGVAYSAVPGRYVGCRTMTVGQKAWATK
ncbi:MAG: gluconate 2-dehydrogenase subunit 3 family protein [Bacteroidetes bacterium]|nr:gluconate 2-dehydrogenase subunit 3 family protein [Fibrella sp.]